MNPIDNPSTKIAWKIRDIQHCHLCQIQNVLAKYDLHFGQPRILHVVDELNGATQNEIAQKLEVSPASVAMSIKRLQKTGLLEKITDEKDLRINQIRLTEKGKRVQNESFIEVQAADNQMLSGFSQEEVKKLIEFLDRIYNNLSKTEEFHG